MAQPLTDAIEALTTYANTVTGKTPPDTTLSDAVATLASGYGGGGASADDVARGLWPNGDIEVTTLQGYSFYNFDSITNVTITGNSISGSYQLAQAGNIDTVVANSLTSIGTSQFRDTFFKRLIAQNVTTLGSNALRGNSSLQVVDCKATSIAGYCMDGLTGILILRADSVCTLTGTALKSSANALTVYVPSSLKSEYEQAANWSSKLSSGYLSFANLESSQYESLDWWK